jgi:molecular chaperone GrpE
MSNPFDTASGQDAPGNGGDPLPDSLEAALAEAEAKAQEHWNSYLRAVAEAENVRKRAQRDVEAASRYAVERFAGDLLEVRDSLELGLQAGASAEPARLLEGMEATLRLLNRAFEKAGVSVLDPAGEPFNPELHEAMAMQPSADQPAGTVLAVVQKGYVLNGRLLRPARVLVAREPDPAAPHPGAN